MSFTIQWIGGRLGDTSVREIVDTWEDALQICEIYTYLDKTGELFERAHIYNEEGVLAGVYEIDEELKFDVLDDPEDGDYGIT